MLNYGIDLLLPLVFLVLRTSNSDWHLHISSPDLRPLNYTIAFPGCPACRQHTVGLHSLHDCGSEDLIINQSINQSISLSIDINVDR